MRYVSRILPSYIPLVRQMLISLIFVTFSWVPTEDVTAVTSRGGTDRGKSSTSGGLA